MQGDNGTITVLPHIATGLTAAEAKQQDGSGLRGVCVLRHSDDVGAEQEQRAVRSNQLSALSRRGGGHSTDMPSSAQQLPDSSLHTALLPVTVNQEGTVFTLAAHALGRGDLQAHEDVSSALLQSGHWQAAIDNLQDPRAPVALAGALEGLQPLADGSQPALVDIGAGYGVYTMTAAARGHKVLAVELASRSRAALEASVRANGFHDRVVLSNATAGALAGTVICVQRSKPVPKWLVEDMQRGFAAPSIHRHVATGCKQTTLRLPMAALVPRGWHVGAVRISAGAWTGLVLKEALYFLREQRPAAILLEVDMALMMRVGFSDFERLVQTLVAAGYSDLAHAGAVCRKRFAGWAQVQQRQAQRGGGQGVVAQQEAAPTWCSLAPSQLTSVLQQNRLSGYGVQDRQRAAAVELLLLQLDASDGQDDAS